MGNLFAYSLILALALIILFAVYRALLSGLTFFRFNRMMILAIYLLSLIIIPFSMMEFAGGVGNVTMGHVTLTAVSENEIQVGESAVVFPFVSLLIWIYAIGLVLMVLRFIITVGRIVWIVNSNGRSRIGKYILVLHHNCKLVPFSWGRYIIMSRNDYDEYGEVIVKHESAHLDNYHWLDLLVSEFVIIMGWYNPVSWLMRDELQDLHEYEADATVLNNGVDNREYQMFLIKKAVGARFASIANSLNHSSLKKRITMMLSKKSRSKARIRAFAMVPATALALVLVNNSSVASALTSVASIPMLQSSIDKGSENSSKNAVSKLVTDNSMSVEENIVLAPDKLPQFPGGMDELMSFIGKNIKYPQSAKEAGISGNVVVRFGVSSTGKVGEVEVLKKVDPALDAEAVRVIGLLPDFIPGESKGEPVATKFTIPIIFSL